MMPSGSRYSTPAEDALFLAIMIPLALGALYGACKLIGLFWRWM